MKKFLKFSLIFFTVFNFSTLLFSLELNDFSFDQMDFHRAALLNKAYSMAQIDEYKLYYFPSFILNKNISFSGDFYEGAETLNITPSFMICQNLPGMASLNLDFSYDYMKSEYFNGGVQHFKPSLLFEFPLGGNKKLYDLYNQFGTKYYHYRKENAELTYNINISEGIRNIISIYGEYIYLRNKKNFNGEKISLLKNYCSDLEKLFLLGKISSMELNESYSEYYELNTSQLECELKFLQAEQKIYEAGGSIISDDISFEDFIAFWKDYLEEKKSTFYKEKLELNEIESYGFLNAYNLKESMNYLDAGFSLITSSVGGVEDFSNFDWNFTLGFKIKVFPDFGNCSRLKEFNCKADLFNIEKAKIIRQQRLSDENRKKSEKLYQGYILANEKLLKIEEERLISCQRLKEMGKISDFDLKFQKNTVDFCRLNKLYSEFQLLLLKASFY